MVGYFKKLGSQIGKVGSAVKSYSKSQLKEIKEKRAMNKLEYEKKSKIVNSLTNEQIKKLARAFISSNPQIRYRDSQGNIKTREPTRIEYIKGIMQIVPRETIISYLKLKIDNSEKAKEKAKKILSPVRSKKLKKKVSIKTKAKVKKILTPVRKRK